MAKRIEKLVNPKKSVFLFSKEKPYGEMFNFVDGKESKEYKSMLENGYFDTPAKLDLPDNLDTGITIEQAKNANPSDLKNLVESYGFIVLTPEQMKAEVNKISSIAFDISKFGDAEFIAEAERRGLKAPDSEKNVLENEMLTAFNEEPTSLTKSELKALGNGVYGLSLKMNYTEAKMIAYIEEAQKGLKMFQDSKNL